MCACGGRADACVHVCGGPMRVCMWEEGWCVCACGGGMMRVCEWREGGCVWGEGVMWGRRRKGGEDGICVGGGIATHCMLTNGLFAT